MNLRGALLEYCHNAAYIQYVMTVFFLSVCDTPEVSCTAGSEKNDFLVPGRVSLHPDDVIG
jgi:hypothetical protein